MNDIFITTKLTNPNNVEKNITRVSNIVYTANRNGLVNAKFTVFRNQRITAIDFNIGSYCVLNSNTGTFIGDGIVLSINPIKNGSENQFDIEMVGWQYFIKNYGSIGTKSYVGSVISDIITDLLTLVPQIKVGALLVGGNAVAYNSPNSYPAPRLDKAISDVLSHNSTSNLTTEWRIGKDRKFSMYYINYDSTITNYVQDSRYNINKANTIGIDLRKTIDDVWTAVNVYYPLANKSWATATAIDTAALTKYGVTLPNDANPTVFSKQYDIKIDSALTIDALRAQYIADTALMRLKKVGNKSNNVTINQDLVIFDRTANRRIHNYEVQCGEWVTITDLNENDIALIAGQTVENRFLLNGLTFNDNNGGITLTPESTANVIDYINKLTKELAFVRVSEDSLDFNVNPRDGQIIFRSDEYQYYQYNITYIKWYTREVVKTIAVPRIAQPVAQGSSVTLDVRTPSKSDSVTNDAVFVANVSIGVITSVNNTAGNNWTFFVYAINNLGNTVILSNGVYNTNGSVAGIYKEIDVPINLTMTNSLGLQILITSSGTSGTLICGAVVNSRFIKYPALYRDTFTRANSAISAGIADTGQELAVTNSANPNSIFGIVSNKLYCVSAVISDSQYIVCNIKNFTMSYKTTCYYNVTNYKLIDIGLHGYDYDNFIRVVLYNNLVDIRLRDLAIGSSLGSQAFTLTDLTEYTVNVTWNEGVITVQVVAPTVSTLLTVTLTGGNLTKYNTKIANKFIYLFNKGGAPGASNATIDDISIV